MGNLGKYEEIVTAAKLAGGVDQLIRTIEDAAVADRFPVIFAKGSAFGVLITALAGAGAVTARHHWIRRRDRRAQADKAREALRAEVGGSAPSDQIGGGATGPEVHFREDT